MSQIDNMTPEEMRARINQLDAEIRLHEKLGRIEARLKAGTGYGSPAAIPVHHPRYLIAPHPGPAAAQNLRAEFAKLGNYEKM